MTWLTPAEHAALMQRVKDRERRQRPTPISKSTDWSPISPDPSGGWLLYGEHYDTREAAEVALAERHTSMRDEHGIGIYPVGLLLDIRNHRVRQGLGYLRICIKARNWRAVRNYFNGYLAEWHYPPADVQHNRCGTGWTRRAALRSLGHHIIAANLSREEALR